LGDFNAQVVNNLSINIIENSYGKPYIKMDEEYFVALQQAKRDNYELIYKNKEIHGELQNNVRPMFTDLYEKLLKDLVSGDKTSPIFKHHINYINKSFYKRQIPYEETEPNQIVVDFIASMTDDYFVDIHAHLFPDSKYKIRYKGYTD
jgi:dGTPase